MEYTTDILVLGAGPYGLSLSAKLHTLACDHLVVGEPMSFWRDHMPEGMFLRSDWDWSLDPTGTFTILRFMEERGYSRADVTPFPLDVYLDYVEWFRRGKGISSLPYRIVAFDRSKKSHRFVAQAEDGARIHANRVVLALGFSDFGHLPDEYVGLATTGKAVHTVEYVDLDSAKGEDVLIVGGRQSAFEWAALLAEAGARRVYLSHRHPSPAFEHADWTWVSPIVDEMVDNPGWYRNLTAEEQQAVSSRLWAEGRLKVEPWLEERLKKGPVTVMPGSRVAGLENSDDEKIFVTFEGGDVAQVDRVVLATGYKPDIRRIPMLANGSLLLDIRASDGVPELDEGFQTSVPGLYATSMLATGSFGPFFAFTVGCRASAEILGRALTTISPD